VPFPKVAVVVRTEADELVGISGFSIRAIRPRTHQLPRPFDYIIMQVCKAAPAVAFSPQNPDDCVLTQFMDAGVVCRANQGACF